MIDISKMSKTELSKFYEDMVNLALDYKYEPVVATSFMPKDYEEVSKLLLVRMKELDMCRCTMCGGVVKDTDIFTSSFRVLMHAPYVLEENGTSYCGQYCYRNRDI